MFAAVPRSTRIHSGSCPSALAHRVDEFPSTALAASNPVPSTDEAVAGLPCESRVSAAEALRAVGTNKAEAMTAAAVSPRSRYGISGVLRAVKGSCTFQQL